jgi:hypothetical protein
MYLEEFGFAARNLQRILSSLKKIYNTSIDFSLSTAQLTELHNFYNSKKEAILRESSFNSYCTNPEYTKALLVCEAIKIFLSEIAPGRSGATISRKIREEIEPEIEFGSNMNDAGQSFDGDDLSDDYANDRNPNRGTPVYNFDYDDLDNWLESVFLIEPETGNPTEEGGEPEAGDVNDKVAKKYYDTPGPDANDYADDRNPEVISGMMDGPGYHKEDVIDQLLGNPEDPSKETKIGLPKELEKTIKADYTSNRIKNPIAKGDPRKDDAQRTKIPSPTDLQASNNKEMYGASKPKKEVSKKEDNFAKEPKNDSKEETKESYTSKKLALKVVKELNSTNIGKILEAAKSVATKSKVDLAEVLTAYEIQGKKLLKEYGNNIDDPVYHAAMLTALELIGNASMRKMLQHAQQTYDADKSLFNFLINKAKAMGFEENAKQFAFAAHNALLQADLKGFIPGRPVYERNLRS